MDGSRRIIKLQFAIVFLRSFAAAASIAALVSAILFSLKERDTNIFLYCAGTWGLCLNAIEIRCILSRRYRLPYGAVIALDLIEICISAGSVIVLMFFYRYGPTRAGGTSMSHLFNAQKWTAIVLAALHTLLAFSGSFEYCLWVKLTRGRDHEGFDMS
ncbi:hypothetical protein BJ875DRAFT_194334 [Amylocarpus encephaloides]|uniref:Uncharacterized protein n=1 Tax=Amylocarpus encephaloides TaxID=45428 RepID=A0A9P8C123_9HELO|nr:hypothetical protein BJ875DRAFT_194334 [Amylocarpus encephaloides]